MAVDPDVVKAGTEPVAQPSKLPNGALKVPHAFERQIKFLTPNVSTGSDTQLWKEIFGHGGEVVNVHQIKPWTFVEYPTVAEADAAYKFMKERNVVGSLVRTIELSRSLRGEDPVKKPEKAKRPAFHKQLKFLTNDVKELSEEEIKDVFLSAGHVVGLSSLGPWTFVEFRSPQKARSALISMKEMKECPTSLRETFELSQTLGPVVVDNRPKSAYERQLKFETKQMENKTILEIKKMFESGGTVSKVFHLGRWTFVEYPSVEEAEAAFNIMDKKKEVSSLERTEEMTEALKVKKRARQLRISRAGNENTVEEIIKKCSSSTVVPIGVYQSWYWNFIEFTSSEEADTCYKFLYENKVFPDVQRTSEMREWLAKSRKSNAECQIKFKTGESAETRRSLVEVKKLFDESGSVVQVFKMGHFTFVEFPSCREAMKAFDMMKSSKEIEDLQQTRELKQALEDIPKVLEE